MLYQPPAFDPAQPPVRAALIGVGQFGRSLLARCRHLPGLELPLLCDREPERAVQAFLGVGGDAEAITVAVDARSAKAALERGQTVVVEDGGLLMDLPFDLLVEATGEPETAARHGVRALEHGKHLAMVTKEADSVIGPLLAARAARAGLVHTVVDGDQPSLLIRLVGWARSLGLEIAAAGKSSEYDFVFDPATETVSVLDRRIEVPGMSRLWARGGDIAPLLAERARLLEALPQRTVPDFCEMGLVANATGLLPDNSAFHAPVMRTLEVPSAFCPTSHGGLLRRTAAIDVFNCLRRPDEASFAGGVFVVVRTDDPDTWAMLGEKGIPLSEDGSHALLYHPAHLLGVEAPLSLIAAARGGTGLPAPEPRTDVIARAARTLAAGTRLEAVGHHHTIDGTEPLLVAAGPIGEGLPLPYYLLAGRTLRADVPKGMVITADMVETPADSTLWQLRIEQDRAFDLAVTA
jgi:predicted homoserine dehydrogenase-like protein